MKPQQDIRAELDAALSEGQRLRDEVRQLKEALARNSIPLPEPENKPVAEKLCLPAPTEIANIAPPPDKEAKVALFRSVFRGREDVYADRWRMKDGKWGYRPAGKKDWQAVQSQNSWIGDPVCDHPQEPLVIVTRPATASEFHPLRTAKNLHSKLYPYSGSRCNSRAPAASVREQQVQERG